MNKITTDRVKILLSHECDSIIKNTIELKRAMLRKNNVDVDRNVKQIIRNFDMVKVFYKNLKKQRKG